MGSISKLATGKQRAQHGPRHPEPRPWAPGRCGLLRLLPADVLGLLHRLSGNAKIQAKMSSPRC